MLLAFDVVALARASHSAPPLAEFPRKRPSAKARKVFLWVCRSRSKTLLSTIRFKPKPAMNESQRREYVRGFEEQGFSVVSHDE